MHIGMNFREDILQGRALGCLGVRCVIVGCGGVFIEHPVYNVLNAFPEWMPHTGVYCIYCTSSDAIDVLCKMLNAFLMSPLAKLLMLSSRPWRCSRAPL